MSAATSTPAAPRVRKTGMSRKTKRIIGIAAVVVLIGLMLLGTKFVPAGSTLGAGPEAFDPAAYGAKQFPIQQQLITSAAVDAETLGKAIAADQTAAGEKYGITSNDGASTQVPVKFTGVVGTVPDAGYTPVKVSGLPSGTKIAVQLGPAVTGTDLRDFGGKTSLNQFENQIQFQNAGDAINDQLKQVLSKADGGDPSSLEGKTITVTGVFSLVNPQQWNVTPATIEVQ